MVFRSLAARWMTFSVVVGLSLVASAAQPIRSMAVSVNKTAGIVTSFDLTFGTTPAATALYACWDAADRGETTNDWAHVEKICDIAGSETALNVPVSRFPQWGGEGCRALRFVMEPGALFDRAGTFLMTENNGGQYIDTGFMLDKTDAMDVSWTHIHASAQPNTVVCGSVAYDTSKNSQDYFYVRYAGGNKVEAGLSKRSGSADKNTAAGVSWTKAVPAGATDANQKYINDDTRVRVSISATEQSIWTNSVNSAGTVFGDEVRLAHNEQVFDASFSQQTNCFLFAWPGYDAGGGLAWWPNSAQGNKLMAKMYNFDIMRSGEPAVSLLPVKKDGVACFYDTVRKVFLYNIGTGAFSLSSASPDVSVATEAVLYDGPCATMAIDCPDDATAAVVAGRVESAGLQASSVSILFAYAPVGTELPDMSVLKEGLASGSDYSAEVAGLTPGTCYAYKIDFVNDLGVRLPQPLTGTFYAGLVNEWTGPASGGDWANGGNWSRGRKPAATDVVTVPAEVSVGMGEAMPKLSSLTVAGMLTVTGWVSKVSAESVVVADGGVITCAGGATTETELSRVWIACGNLTVAPGGSIDVRAKGFQPYPSTTMPSSADAIVGYGPGSMLRGGASHGGVGGYYRGYTLKQRVMPYGSAEEPVTAGSSGGGSKWGVGTAGGGVVRIEATGAVEIGGTIDADASHDSPGGTYDGAGAGGSIYIACATFRGNGLLTAAGWGGNRTVSGAANINGHPGGGGRIAVHYDTSLQTADMVEGMRISVAEGRFQKTAWNGQDAYQSDPDMGTLWFPDDKMLVLLGKGLWGQLCNISTSLAFDKIEMTWGRVRFVRPGTAVSVTGDVVLDGDTARLEFGGDTPTNRTFDCELMTSVPWSFTVGGDLAITNGARFDARAAATNGTTDVAGGLVSVDGCVTIANGSSLYAWSDTWNGGSPRFAVGALNVLAGGLLSAEHRGFTGGVADSNATIGFSFGKGPGGGGNPGWYSQGGGHGGHGGLEGRIDDSSHDYGSHVNDWEYVPTIAGSGGGGDGWARAGNGGGVVAVTASGDIRVDGTINADGIAAAGGCGGSGAGGTICLVCKTFSGADTGVLSAKGGDGCSNSNQSGAGGGGRIAIWTGEPWNGRTKTQRLQKSATPHEFEGGLAYRGAYSVAGGASEGGVSSVSCAGADGTCWFFNVLKPFGMMLLVR